MMLNLYIATQFVRRDLDSWLATQRQRMLAEEGMSETIQNVLWAIFAIAAVGYRVGGDPELHHHQSRPDPIGT